MKKIFEGYLLLDWRKKSMSVKKRKPKNCAASVIPVKINIEVDTPEMPELILKGNITIPEAKMGDMFLEAL